MTLSLRNKLLAVAIATTVFVALAGMLAGLMDYPLGQTLTGATPLGLLIASIETFYVGGRAGRWLRAMHPVGSLLIYGLILVAVGLVVMHVNHALLGRWARLPEAYARLPLNIPLMFGIALVAITALRIVGFVGARNVLHLVLGTYHRPVLEERVFLFLDIKGSTAMVESLGPVRARALIGKFFFDISAPITDHGGDIYRFTGDGLVATWPWKEAVTGGAVVDAVLAIQRAVREEHAHYRERFERVPEFRVGIHGGRVVVSEEGDTRRAIGFYGDTIHIAARMEQKAKELGVDTVISEEIFQAFKPRDHRLVEVARDTVRGISRPIRMYTLADAAPAAGV